MTHPKTITIYLANGQPNGVKTAELSNWIGKAIVISRSMLKSVKERAECNQPAVYFLIGKNDEDDILPLVYVGEAESLWDRLANHDSNKDFWQTAIGFVGKDNGLTKAHIKYLESRCLKIAKDNSRCILQNTVQSALPSLPEPSVAEMEEFLENLITLLSSISYLFLLKPLVDEEKTGQIFFCRAKGAEAKGQITNDGFIVFKDSTMTTNISKAVKERNSRIIESLSKSGHITQLSSNLFKFEKEYVFNSPSAASDIICGNSTSGWVKWVTKEGKTLKDVETEKLES
jgi:hypothetical protein